MCTESLARKFLILPLLLSGVASAAADEPIRLVLDEEDQPLTAPVPKHDDQVAPAQFVRPLGKRPFRPFSLSLTEKDTPISTEQEEAQPATAATATPTSPQDTDVQVKAPPGAQVSEQASPGALRIYRIHEQPIDNPAIPAGTPRYQEQPLPHNPAGSSTVTPPTEAQAQPNPALSRFSSSATHPQAPSAPDAGAAAPADATPHQLTLWNVTPGSTQLSAIRTAWGEPDDVRRFSNGKTVELFQQLPGFARVEVGIDQEQVASIYAILDEPISREQLASHLDLASVEPAEVRDERGRHLGTIYPERGVMLPQSEGAPAGQVVRLIRQPPRAEAFVTRARGRSPLQLRSRLDDLSLALQIEPYHADAWFEKSKVLHRLGQVDEAFEAARQATSGIGATAEHRLQRSLLSAHRGDIAGASHSTQQIAEDDTLPPHIRAAAYCQWGDLLQQTGSQKNREAVAHHVKAIELAAPVVNDSHVAVRRAAKRTLIDAHLALAVDIAAGDWENKEATVGQWLKRSKIYIDDMRTNEQATAELELAWLRVSLQARSFFDKQFDPTETVDLILGKYRELISQTDDPFFHRALEWETGQSLVQAVLLENSRGRHDTALALADQARGFLKGGSVARQLTAADHLLIGNFYFRAGVILAVHKKEHAAATHWYDLALSHLTSPQIDSVMIERRGESLVSMGVSYWETGSREQGVALSEQGMRLLEEAVAQKLVPEKKLIVPLENLAQMYRQLGDSQKSAQYTASLQRIQQSSPATGDVSR